MKNSKKRMLNGRLKQLTATAFLLSVLVFCVCTTGISGIPLPPKARLDKLTGNQQSDTKRSIDSAINEVALSINQLMNQNYPLNRMDSLHLRELSSRLSFLSQLADNIKSGDNGSYNLQQNGLSFAILFFGLLSIAAILVFQIRERKGMTYMTFKLLGLVFIGTISVFLIPAGFDNNQITPVIGLLGTLAGYLIGSTRSGVQEPTTNDGSNKVPNS